MGAPCQGCQVSLFRIVFITMVTKDGVCIVHVSLCVWGLGGWGRRGLEIVYGLLISVWIRVEYNVAFKGGHQCGCGCAP